MDFESQPRGWPGMAGDPERFDFQLKSFRDGMHGMGRDVMGRHEMHGMGCDGMGWMGWGGWDGVG